MKTKISISEKCLSPEEIKEYTSGSMNEKFSRRVEEHLIDCPLCSEAVDGAELLSKNDITTRIENINKKIVNKGINLAKGIKYFSMAALLLIAVGVVFKVTEEDLNKTTFLKYYKIYPDITQHTRGENSKTLLSDGLDYYNEGQYEPAIKIFDSILETNADDYALFYKSISLMEIDKISEATVELLKITKNENSVFYCEANWYLSLCYIYNHKNERVKKYLDVASGCPDYSEKVNQIIKGGLLNRY